MAQQTAVDYFAQWVSYHKLNQNLTLMRLDELITNAKLIEKEQCKEAYLQGSFDDGPNQDNAEQYYNEKYKK